MMSEQQQPPILNLRVYQDDEVIVDVKELGNHLRWYKARLHEPLSAEARLLALLDGLEVPGNLDYWITAAPDVLHTLGAEIAGQAKRAVAVPQIEVQGLEPGTYFVDYERNVITIRPQEKTP